MRLRYQSSNICPVEITVVEYSPYYPDVTLSYFFLFPEIKETFSTVEEVKAKATELLRSLTEIYINVLSSEWNV